MMKQLSYLIPNLITSIKNKAIYPPNKISFRAFFTFPVYLLQVT